MQVSTKHLTAIIESAEPTPQGKQWVATVEISSGEYSSLIRCDSTQGWIASPWTDIDGIPLDHREADLLRDAVITELKQSTTTTP